MCPTARSLPRFGPVCVGPFPSVGLRAQPTSDILSDMKTYTVRDLDRQPGVVLDACDQQGAVRIRRRNGRSYTLRPDAARQRSVSAAERKRWLDEHWAWLERTFSQPISARQTALVDRLIAGE